MRRQQSKKRNKEKEKQSGILASASINTGKTPILTEDLFAEPTRRQQEFASDSWIHFFDKEYNFYNNLCALLNNSPTLRSIIHDKATLAVGDGFIPIARDNLDIGDDITQVVEDETESVNLYQESLSEVNFKIFYDFFAFGNAIVEMVETQLEGKPVTYLYHIPIDMVAFKKAGKDRLIKTVGICENWIETSIKDRDINELPLYPTWTSEGGDRRTVIHIKNYAPGFFYWGVPEWVSARMWAEIEYRMPKYNISKFVNGYTPSSIVQFFGSVTKEEAQSIIKNFTEKFTDTGNNNKIFAQVLRDEKLKANVQVLEDKNDGSYMELQKIAAQALVTANRWTMSLAGFATSGKLGSNQQIRQEFEIAYNTVIKPAQKLAIKRIVRPFIKKNDKLKEIDLMFSSSIPISFAGSIDVDANLLTNEKREMLGVDPLDEEGLAQLTVKTKENDSPLADNRRDEE